MKYSQEVIYEPNHIIKAGIGIWTEMLYELVNAREIIWRLFMRDISARYKQSALGIFWTFLSPLIIMTVFVWSKRNNLLPIRETEMPYTAFVFYGQMIWLLFAQGLANATTSLTNAGAMVTKINFPKETLVISATGQSVFEFIIRIPLLLVVFFLAGFSPKNTILLVPLVVLPIVFLTIGLGFVLSLLNAVIRDVSNILAIATTLGMFATTVVYPPPTLGPLAFLINHINPVSAIINTSRDLVTLGHITQPSSYVSACLFSVLVFGTGWRLFHLLEPKIAERV